MLRGQAPYCVLHQTRVAGTVRKPAHTRGHAAGICCGNSFSHVTSPFSRKNSVAGTEL